MSTRRETFGIRKRTPNARLADLQERLAALEGNSDRPVQRRGNRGVPDHPEHPRRSPKAPEARTTVQVPQIGSNDVLRWGLGLHNAGSQNREVQIDPAAQEGELEMVNPLSAGPPDMGFIHDAAKDRAVYLGTSSNWSFSRRVLDSAHRAASNIPLAPDNFALDGDICSLDGDESKNEGVPENLSLPSFSHAKYLVQSLQFHVGELYHLLDEGTFIARLSEFYQSSGSDTTHRGLWYVHYLLVMALGKSCVSQRLSRGRPPGAQFFVEAMRLLPDVYQLWTDTFTATEIFCCAALYLQGTDYRYGAYMMIGDAMRTALFQGMHTNMPAGLFGASKLERARRIWWTIYILDRELSSLMGLPVQLSDELITASLPASGSNEQETARTLHIKLCRLNAQVVSSVYGPDGRLDKTFLTSTKVSLTQIAKIAEPLSRSFRLPLDDSSEDISRLAATLHLQHHQCVVLTTRPLIFSLYKKRLEHPRKSLSMMASMDRLRVLLQMGVDSAQHLLSILSALLRQDSLESFIPFDLEYTFSSAVIVLIAACVEPALIEDVVIQRTKAFAILDDLIIKGNQIAARRKAELQQLDALLTAFMSCERGMVSSNQPGEVAGPHTQQDASTTLAQGEAAAIPKTTALTNDFQLEDWSWQDALDADQLLNVVDLLDLDQLEAFSADFSFA